MANTPVRCPRCGAPLDGAAGELCPACLLKMALDAGSVAPLETEDAGETRLTPIDAMTGDPAETRLTPAGHHSTATPAPARAPLEAIGPYRIVSVLGEGGMGVVYLAEQTAPIRRQVALKVIKLGMDTREVVARFESERQALALMEHPNIARVIDAGATPDGRPFFVMEHVPGVPITDYCDAHRLSTRARIALVAQVCGAIQHAHQKGIIHRDLKPSNVLVTEQDGIPTPKIIDFGIAKATDQRLTERTMFTEQGQFMGTPEYMSPEQTGMAGLDVDATTDIYSIGVVMYELLAGALPFDPESLRRAGYAEMQRIIREDEPPKPSTRVSTLGAAAIGIADQRHTDRGALRKQLAGDLDWITLKAMEKDRTRRYASASEFAADLARYLNNEPVLASPPSRAYRAQKFVRRNRLAVTAAGLVALAVVAGLVVSSVLYIREGRARRDAVAQKREAQVQSYIATITAADLGIKNGDIASARDLLDKVPDALRGWEWRYLWRRADSPRTTFVDPRRVNEFSTAFGRDSIYGFSNSIVFGASGAEVVSWSRKSVTRWNLKTRGRLQSDGPFSFILTVSDDASLVADRPGVGGSTDGARSVAVYTAAGAARRCSLDGHDSDVTVAAFSPDGRRLVVGTAAGSVYLWDTVDCRQAGRVAGRAEPIRSVAFKPDGRALAATSSHATRILDADTLTVVQAIEEGAIRVRFSPNGLRLLLAVADWNGLSITAAGLNSADADLSLIYGGPDSLSRTTRLRDSTTGQAITVIKENGQVISFAVSPDGFYVATVTYRDLRTWLTVSDARTGERIAATPLSDDAEVWGRSYASVTFTPDGSRILTSSGGQITSWPLALDSALTRLRDFTGTRPAFSSDGQLLATAHTNGAIRIWNVQSGAEITTLEGHAKAVHDLVFAGPHRLISGSADGTIRIWDVTTGRSLRVIADSGNGDGPKLRAASSTGQVFASVTGRRVTVRDTQTGNTLDHVDCPAAPSVVGFSRDGGRVFIGMTADRVLTETTRDEHGNFVVVSAEHDKQPMMLVWDRRERRFVGFGSKGESVSDLALSDDGEFIALTRSGPVTVWSSDLGRQILALTRPAGTVVFGEYVLFTPDGSRVLTREQPSGDLRVWDARSGRLLLTIPAAATAWTLSPDGGRLAYVTGGQLLRFLTLK